MNELIKSQLYFFVWSFVIGISLALCYDVIRIIRRVIPHNKTVIGIEDFLFWIVTSVIMFSYVFKTNSGNVRGFFFFGVCMGVMFYLGLFSYMIIDNISKAIIFTINKVIAFSKILIKPIIFLGKPIWFLIKKIIWGLKKVGKCLIINTRRLMKEIRCILYKI